MMKFLISIIGILFLLQSCRTENIVSSNSNSDKDYYIVTNIKKQRNSVYIIYANKNDSVFKIFSHFDGKIGHNDIKLKKGFRFKAKLNSQFKDTENKFKMMSQNGISILFFGVTISKEPGNNINDIYYCKKLNGKYISKKLIIGDF